ncbi:MAG: TatD family hydrolase [Caldilineaceae bacterium]
MLQSMRRSVFILTAAGTWARKRWKRYRELAAHPKVVAIGEIGLDYYWDKVEPSQQQKAFREQLALAADLGLPVIIHNRDATDDTIAILQEWTESADTQNSALARRPFWGVLHAFGGDLALAHKAYDWNFVLGIGGPVTFRNARTLHEVATQLDPKRLMVETDAPYLTPHPYRGKRNEPAYVALVCAQLAKLRQVEAAVIAQQTSTVATTFFGLPAK